MANAPEVITYAAPATVNVGVATTQIIAANTARRHLIIVNDSDTTIYLAVGNPAVLASGIRINAAGGAFTMDRQNLATAAVNGIHGGIGNKAVTVHEAT